MAQIIKILFDDNKIIVAEKPPGILSQSDFTNREDMLNLIKAYIVKKYSKPGRAFVGLVHRLDKEVGGVMVFARNSKVAKKLSLLIQSRNFHKKYIAVIQDFILPETGILRDVLIKNPKLNITKISTTSLGKFSELKYKILQKQNNFSLIEIELITGRSHQIRVQFASRKCPLYGDVKYGGEINMSDKNRSVSLWAYSLSFDYPNEEAKKVEFISYPPQAFPWNQFNFPL